MIQPSKSIEIQFAQFFCVFQKLVRLPRVGHEGPKCVGGKYSVTSPSAVIGHGKFVFAQKRIANSRPKPVTREVPISGRAPRRGRKSGCTWRASARLHFAPRALRVIVSVPHNSVNSTHAVRPAARLSPAFFAVRKKCFCARYGIRISIRTIAQSIFALSLAFCAESQRQAGPGKNTKNRAKEPTSSKIGVAPTSGPRAARFLRVPGQPNRGLATMI